MHGRKDDIIHIPDSMRDSNVWNSKHWERQAKNQNPGTPIVVCYTDYEFWRAKYLYQTNLIHSCLNS